jgi:hypothetical protein
LNRNSTVAGLLINGAIAGLFNHFSPPTRRNLLFHGERAFIRGSVKAFATLSAVLNPKVIAQQFRKAL